MATNFDLAPPPVTVGGITIVPVDIQTIDARLVFNGETGVVVGGLVKVAAECTVVWYLNMRSVRAVLRGPGTSAV